MAADARESRKIHVTAAASVWQRYFSRTNVYVLERLRAAVEQEKTELVIELPVASANEAWTSYFRRVIARWCAAFQVPAAAQPADAMQMEEWRRTHVLAAQHSFTPAEATEAVMLGARMTAGAWEEKGVTLHAQTRRLSEQEVASAPVTRGRLRHRANQPVHIIQVTMRWELDNCEEEEEQAEAEEGVEEGGEGEEERQQQGKEEEQEEKQDGGKERRARQGGEEEHRGRAHGERQQGGRQADGAGDAAGSAAGGSGVVSRWARMRSASPQPRAVVPEGVASHSREKRVDISRECEAPEDAALPAEAERQDAGGAAGGGRVEYESAWPPEPVHVPEGSAGMAGSELERMIFRVHESVKVLHREREVAQFEMRRARQRAERMERALRSAEAEMDKLRMVSEQLRLNATALQEELLEAKQQHRFLEDGKRRAESAVMQSHAKMEAQVAGARATAQAEVEELRRGHRSTLDALRKEHEAAMQKVRAASQEMLDGAHAQTRGAIRERENAVAEARELQERVQGLTAANKEARAELASARAELEEVRASLESTAARRDELAAELEASRKECAAAKALCRVMETETEAHSLRVVELGKQRAQLRAEIAALRGVARAGTGTETGPGGAEEAGKAEQAEEAEKAEQAEQTEQAEQAEQAEEAEEAGEEGKC